MSAPLVHDLLVRSAQRRPEAPLVVDARETRTYGQVDEDSDRIAWTLHAQGVGRGDRVGLICENSGLYVAAYYGILKAGGMVVSLSPTADSGSIGTMLRDCDACGAICGDTQGRAVGALQRQDGLRFVLTTAGVGTNDDRSQPCRVVDLAAAMSSASRATPSSLTESDRAAIVYTSGSTRKPRGAVLRHANLVSNVRSIVQYLGLGPSDRIFVVLPFHYVYGKSLLNTHVAVGGAVVLEHQFLYPQKALDRLEREAATGLSGVPSTFAILLNKSNFASRAWPALRYVTQAGGAMAPELTRRLIAALPGKRIFVMYGATEASARLAYLDPTDLPRKIGSIGKAIPGVDVRVLREDGAETEVDEVGEIVARGPNVMEGYWNDPVETAAVLDAHGYHTGDLGRRDEEGFLYVVGRKREMIKSGAHRISPLEIEETLVEHPAVGEAAVIGVPDEILGEAIVAFVTLRSGGADAPVDDFGAWCRSKLPPHKVPGRIAVVESLPRNGAGKIDKLRLAANATEIAR